MEWPVTNLVINGVKLGEDYSIDEAGVVRVGEICQGVVELGELIHSLIPYQSFSNKQHQVWTIHLDQLDNKKGNRKIVNARFLRFLEYEIQWIFHVSFNGKTFKIHELFLSTIKQMWPIINLSYTMLCKYIY